LATFFSTVTPGQLPTYSVLPVIALKSVVFPELGFPAKASFMVILLLINQKSYDHDNRYHLIG